ncbi:MAG: hypothetical protein ACI4L7_01875 [Christensenellales bacterium]
MKNLKTIQTISKLLYVLAKIAYIMCIVGCVFCALGVVGVATMKDNPEFLKTIADMGETFDYKIWMCDCIFGLVESGFGIAIYYFVQKFYKFELSIGEPFNAKVAEKMKKLGIIRLVLPLVCSVVLGIVFAIFGREVPMFSGFSMTMGFVYLAVSVLIDHHLELEKKHAVELVKGEVEFASQDTESDNNKESI